MGPCQLSISIPIFSTSTLVSVRLWSPVCPRSSLAGTEGRASMTARVISEERQDMWIKAPKQRSLQGPLQGLCSVLSRSVQSQEKTDQGNQTVDAADTSVESGSTWKCDKVEGERKKLTLTFTWRSRECTARLASTSDFPFGGCEETWCNFFFSQNKLSHCCGTILNILKDKVVIPVPQVHELV